ncbi:hypothetical protein [Myxosarcina sp. GI1]|uniref:PFE-CTERM domain-containing protein n=1 Tax=Myxosarcina sp. GI1 TaxID=1541065 RepID=UPI0012E05FBC|nr:hypothetical protein [Myxosarcina sp. GI1]
MNRYSLLSLMIFASGASPVYGVQLDFSSVTGNLTNGDANGVGATMRYNNVAIDNGTTLDMVITTLNSYNVVNTSYNGIANGNDGSINLRNGTSTKFKFSFVKTGTDTPFTVSQIDFGVYDIDGPADGQEKITLYSTSNYTVTENPATALTIDTFIDRVEFTAPIGEVTNPTDSRTLTQQQEQHSVNFRMNNVSEFKLGYEAVNGNSNFGRNIFFAGDVVFDNSTTVITNFQEVPFEFSPGFGLLLSGGSLLGINYLKKRKRFNREIDLA